MGSADPASASAPRRGAPFLESRGLLIWTAVLDAALLVTAWLVLRFTAVQVLLLHLGVLSLLTFLLFAADKWRARRQRRRISEWNLLLLSAFGGALGGVLGMALFRHKTQRWHFNVLVPTFLFVHGVVGTLLVLR